MVILDPNGVAEFGGFGAGRHDVSAPEGQAARAKSTAPQYFNETIVCGPFSS